MWHYFAYQAFWNRVFSVRRPHTIIFTQIRFTQFPLATSPHRNPVGWTPQGFMLESPLDNLSPCCTKTPWATVRYMHHHSSSLDLGSLGVKVDGKCQMLLFYACWVAAFANIVINYWILGIWNLGLLYHMKPHSMYIFPTDYMLITVYSSRSKPGTLALRSSNTSVAHSNFEWFRQHLTDDPKGLWDTCEKQSLPQPFHNTVGRAFSMGFS